MNIHEYQAKALLKSYGAPVAEGVAIFSAATVGTARRATASAWAGTASAGLVS
jgi:succinyl-CoA synthetase beta subunit